MWYDAADPAITRRYTLPHSHRLHGPAQFSAVYDAKVREARGPLNVYALPNGLPHPRLGISIGRHVGTAVKRNLIKRRLREAFRLMQHDLPRGYDLVISVRPHAPAMLADYQRLLMGIVLKLHQQWQRREAIECTRSTCRFPSDVSPEQREGSTAPAGVEVFRGGIRMTPTAETARTFPVNKRLAGSSAGRTMSA